VEHYLNHLKLVSIARVNNTLGSKMRALGVITPICEYKYALKILHSFTITKILKIKEKIRKYLIIKKCFQENNLFFS